MRVLTVAIAVLLVSGCSKTATIYMRDGASFEGKIVRSDESSIYVTHVRECPKKTRKVRSQKICYKEEEPVLRQEIDDIDHPGDISAAIGLTLAVVGATCSLSLLSAKQDCEGDDCWGSGLAMLYIGIPCACVAVVGALNGVGGLITWKNSRSAANPPESNGPKITPVALTDGERTYFGIGMIWSW